jgi:hypothetical protein
MQQAAKYFAQKILNALVVGNVAILIARKERARVVAVAKTA